ncbi:neutrophil collagenase-like [Pangshura tecta]
MGRRRRYPIKPLDYKWDHVNLTYKIVQFPSTLNKADTERAVAAAFHVWSDVSPLRFRGLLPDQLAAITIGRNEGLGVGPGLPLAHWYKDGELLSGSVPGFELLPRQELRVRATEFSEGQYTCLIRHASSILWANSWQIKLKARSLSSHKQPGL